MKTLPTERQVVFFDVGDQVQRRPMDVFFRVWGLVRKRA